MAKRILGQSKRKKVKNGKFKLKIKIVKNKREIKRVENFDKNDISLVGRICVNLIMYCLPLTALLWIIVFFINI